MRVAAAGQGAAALASLALPQISFASAGWPSLVRDGFLLLLVLAGAFAMGLALPAWIACHEDGDRRSALGGWNGWSSLGSTGGAMLAGFVLLPLGGLYLAAAVAAALHALAAALAWREAGPASGSPSRRRTRGTALETAAGNELCPGAAAWLAFLSGFVTVAAQALALRWLLLCFLGFSHVFAAVGATGLLAYAAGSFLGAWRLRGAGSAERRASSALLLAAIGCGAAPFVLELVPGTSGSAAFSSSAPAWRQIAGILLHTAAFLALPVAGAAAWLTPASAALGAHAGARAGTALWLGGAGAALAPLATHPRAGARASAACAPLCSSARCWRRARRCSLPPVALAASSERRSRSPSSY